MGVPITFLDKYSPDQFEIVGISGDLAEPYYDDLGKKHTGRFYLDGRRLYDRLVIRRCKRDCKYKVGDYLTFTYEGERRGAEVTKIEGKDYFVTLKIDGVETEVPSSELSAVRRM